MASDGGSSGRRGVRGKEKGRGEREGGPREG